MFVGGATRAFSNIDQPHPGDINAGHFLGIHGQSRDIAYEDSSRTTNFYQYFLKAIADGKLSGTDTQFLDDALSDHDAAYARIFDPIVVRCFGVIRIAPSRNNIKSIQRIIFTIRGSPPSTRLKQQRIL